MRFTKPITAATGLAAVFAAGCLPAESLPTAVLTPDPLILEVPVYDFGTSSIIGENPITITNNGGENSGVLTTELTGPFYIEYDECDGESLEPGDDCQIYVYYDGFQPDEVSASFIDPTTIEDVGSVTVTGEDTPAPAFVKLVATQQEVQELPN